MATRLGRYAVLKHLASGGMADVLLGRSEGIEGFERHVVVKRIRPEYARDQRFIRMFLDEARVAATLHHQHIVQVYDIGEAGGDYFIAMEYIHGEDVRTILSAASRSRNHVPLGYAIAIVSAAAAGLHYAHERCGADKRPLGIVHRDVSPSNILVGYDGSIKVVDFGIAKAAMREETQSGSLKGKISYMSPEQCKGGEVDRRSDVYALGVVLYELATTTRLFKGENSYLVMDQIVNGRVPPPQNRRPDLPAELATIIQRAIAPDRAKRYATADELRQALDAFAAKSGLTASSSAIAAYMKKQLGHRPEPWLDIIEDEPLLDDVPTRIGAAMPNTSWTEQSRHTGSSEVIHTGDELSDPDRRRLPLPSPSEPTAVIPVTPSTSTSSLAIPTDAKMGWESQPRPAAPARFSPAKAAMIAAPLLLVAGFAIWHFAGKSDPAQVVVVPIARPVPAPAAPAAAPRTDHGVKMPEITLQDPTPEEPKKRTIARDPVRVAAAAPKADPAPIASDLHKLVTPTVPVVETPAPAPVVAPPPPAPVAAPPPAPVPAAPQSVAPGVLEANRLAGDKRILPDELTMASIGRSGKDKVSGSYKVCVGPDGSISAVSVLTSTGYPSYDDRIQSTIRSQWRYRPYLVDGKAVTACTAVRFVYSQK
jgi:serine/threonine protein kinase